MKMKTASFFAVLKVDLLGFIFLGISWCMLCSRFLGSFFKFLLCHQLPRKVTKNKAFKSRLAILIILDSSYKLHCFRIFFSTRCRKIKQLNLMIFSYIWISNFYVKGWFVLFFIRFTFQKKNTQQLFSSIDCRTHKAFCFLKCLQ